ncbi:MAG TPA: EAL domain-containing protein [Longimicrobiales bacterium]
MPEATTRTSERSRLTPELARRLLLDARASEPLRRATHLAALALRAPTSLLGVPERERFFLVSQSGLSAPWSELGYLPLQESCAALVCEARDVVVIDNVVADPLTRDTSPLGNFPCAAYCGIGVRVDGVVVGVLSVTDVHPRRWTLDDLVLLRDIAATVIRDIELLALRGTDEPAAAAPTALQVPEGYVLLDNAGRFTCLNERAEQVLQRTRDTLIGRSVWECFPGMIGTAFHHELLRVLSDQRGVELEDYFQPLDVWLEVRAYPSNGGIALHLRDVTARQAAQRELREREARYRALFEENASAIFMTSREGFILEVNRATLDLFGYTYEEALAMRAADVYCDVEDRVRFQQEMARTGAVVDMEVCLRRKDGEKIDCVVSATAQRSRTGEIIGYHGSVRDVTAAKRAQEKLVESAFQDPLTRLPNRMVFTDRLERLLKHSKRRTGYNFAVLFIDLDRFKVVNDTFGHHAGDMLLTAVARRLEHCVRQEDTVARIGGDEFAVLLDGIGDVASVAIVAQRILDELAEPVLVDSREVSTSTSVGVALSMTGYDLADEIVRDADAAMYRAKASGRSAYVIFDTEMYGRARAQLALESELRAAMKSNQLELHYHPVVALDDGGVTGMEALVRWTHPERGVLLPSEFIPLAESTGLIVEMGWWVLREACRQLRAWQLEYPAAAFRLTMSVNMSARQFVQPNLVKKIDMILNDTELPPSSLRLDLTEAVVMQNADLAAHLLSQLRDRGIQICLDDFGSGYSSLRELSALPISTLKIDPSFVRAMNGGGESHAIVQTIIALGRSMAIDAIAEGVETPEQLAALRTLGTRFAQGFLFSLPLDSEAASTLIAESGRNGHARRVMA